MNHARPAYVTDSLRLAGEIQKAGSADIQVQLCTHHLRVLIRAEWCDDAEWTFEPRETFEPLDHLIAWCRTLATGQDETVYQEAFGHNYRRTFSLDSHVGSNEKHPARQRVWFYPMTEARLCLGVEVGPSITALRAGLTWALKNIHIVDPDARTSILAGIETCVACLDKATDRLSQLSGHP
ncbi:MAG: hypothetical protein IPK82_01515 [Polyangiaceae bacterium]|nr:hypothetical protein [Polyangiaceae bacterium]